MRPRHAFEGGCNGAHRWQRPRRNADYVEEEFHGVDDVGAVQEILAERKAEQVEVRQECPEEVQLVMKAVLRGNQHPRRQW